MGSTIGSSSGDRGPGITAANPCVTGTLGGGTGGITDAVPACGAGAGIGTGIVTAVGICTCAAGVTEGYTGWACTGALGIAGGGILGITAYGFGG